jgi:hypothetical protein
MNKREKINIKTYNNGKEQSKGPAKFGRKGFTHTFRIECL